MDGKTLLNVSVVCKKWNEICKCDTILRKKIRRQIRIEKKFYLHNLLRYKKDHLKRRSSDERVFSTVNLNNKRRRVEGELL